VTPTCRYHCRSCGAHFTSLQAFDAHRVGPWSDRRCELGDELAEIPGGVCRIEDPTRSRIGVTLYAHPDGEGIRSYFRGREAAHTPPTNVSAGVPG
jgi:hypothetical protein